MTSKTRRAVVVGSGPNGLASAITVTKGADLTSNPAQFGLDHPSLVVTLDADGKTTTVNFGKVTIGTGEHALVYVITSARKEPTAVKLSLPEAKTAEEVGKEKLNQIRITVTPDGAIYLDRERIAALELELAALKRQFEEFRRSFE